MTADPSDAASRIAADYAAAARRSLPDPADVVAGRQPVDPQAATAYAALATYFQVHALIARLDHLSSTTRAVQANTDSVHHLAGGILAVIRELEASTAAIARLDRTVEQTFDTPGRRLAHKLDQRWERYKRRLMPPPPPAGVAPFLAEDHQPTPTMTEIDIMESDDFEEHIADMLRDAGWEDVEVLGTRKSSPVGHSDHGVDIIAKHGETVLAVQCKRYSPTNPVRGPELQRFSGGAHHFYTATDLALVTTTDRLTSSARDFVDKAGIVVVDRAALTSWVEDGVVPTAVAALHPDPASIDPGADSDEPRPPAAPRHRWYLTTIILLLGMAFVSVSVYAGPQRPEAAEPALAGAVMLLVLAAVPSLNWQWRLYWWRRGINKYWYWRGWFVPSGGTRAYRSRRHVS